MKNLIVPILFSVIMSGCGLYYLNKFNNYLMQNVVHCYLIEKGEDKPSSETFYTIENGKIINRLEIVRTNYSMDKEKFEIIREKWEGYNKYKGFLISSLQDDEFSFEISYYDFKSLSAEEYTDIWYQEPDSNNYHVPIDMKGIVSIDEDFIKSNREQGLICY